jgi:hypothetical protein
MMPGPAMKALIALVALLALVHGGLAAPTAAPGDCYSSIIVSPSPFMGNNDEIFKLADGTVWKVKYEYEYLYEYQPEVVICPAKRKLLVAKKSLNVELISGAKPVARATPKDAPAKASSRWDFVEETQLQGSISGTIKQGKILKTVSGGIYEITGITLQLVLELQPDVTVLRNGDVYKLIVKGFDEPVLCSKLNNAPPSSPQAKAKGGSTAGSTTVESRVDGEFNGWTGETIVKLRNGQIWQQSRHYYFYRYAYAPNVIVYSNDGVMKMKVDGVDEAVPVRLLNP